MNSNKILIIEDVNDIAKIISLNIKDLNLESTHVNNGKDGLKAALTGSYSLIILDLMLPEIDGITVCSEIRKKDANTPILILTAKGNEIDRVLGLEIGADDYMTKPFSVRELVARIKALLRRSRITNLNEITKYEKILIQNNLSLNLKNRDVLLNNKPIDLTVKEFELLTLFMENPGRTFTREELLEKIWGYNYEGYEHTVNTHINRLRKKIEKNLSDPEYLKTVWGVGYKFNET